MLILGLGLGRWLEERLKQQIEEGLKQRIEVRIEGKPKERRNEPH